jgi:hypothetical protein
MNMRSTIRDLLLASLGAALALGVIAAAVLHYAGGASAQTPPRPPAPRGPTGSGDPGAEAASEAAVQHTSGALISSTVKTDTASIISTPGTAFVTIPVMTVNVPVTACNSDCFLVTLSGNAAVNTTPAATDFCYVRAVAGGATMFPRAADRILKRDTGDYFAESSSQQWSARLTPSGPTLEVKIQWRTNFAGLITECFLSAWTLTVQRFD